MHARYSLLMANTQTPAPAALDRALTFALIEVAAVLLMGDMRGTLSLPQRAEIGRQARGLLEGGAHRARQAVADMAASGHYSEGDAVRAQLAWAETRRHRAARIGDPRAEAAARGELAELAYIGAQLAGR